MGLGTGVASTNDYMLGRGVLMISVLNDTSAAGAQSGVPVGKYEGLMDPGECSEFKLSAENQINQFNSFRAGLVVPVVRVIIQSKGKCSFRLHEISQDVRALFFLGEIAKFIQTGETGITLDTIVLTDNKRWYDLKRNGARAYNITNGVANWTFGGSPVTLTTADLTLDATFGRVFVNKSGGFSSGNTLIIGTVNTGTIFDDTAGAGGTGASGTGVPGIDVRLAKKSGIRAHLKFFGSNAAFGDAPHEVVINRVSLRAEGDSPQIGDDFQSMEITGEFEKETLFAPTAPFGTFTYINGITLSA